MFRSVSVGSYWSESKILYILTNQDGLNALPIGVPQTALDLIVLSKFVEEITQLLFRYAANHNDMILKVVLPIVGRELENELNQFAKEVTHHRDIHHQGTTGGQSGNLWW
jgi:hypothetical protein